MKTQSLRWLLMGLLICCLTATGVMAQPPWRMVASFGYGRMNDIAWTSDGSMVAIASDTAVRLYDPDMVEMGIIYEPDALAVAWQPGGTQIAIVTRQGIAIWDAPAGSTPELLRELPPGIAPLAWSPDGQSLAFSDSEAQIWIYEIETGSSAVAFREHADADPESGNAVWALAWSPDSTHIASSGLNSPLLIWNAATGDVVSAVEGVAAYWYGAIHWRSVDQIIVFEQEYDFSSSIPMKIIENGVVVQEKIVNGGDTDWWVAPDVEFSPDGSYLAVWVNDQSLKLINSSTMEVAASAPLYEKMELAIADMGGKVAWQPGGNILLTGTGSALYRWQVEGETLTLTGSVTDAYATWLNALAWSPDGTQIASAHGMLEFGARGDDNRLRLWDVASGAMLWRTLGETQQMTSLDWSQDGQKIVTGQYLDFHIYQFWNASDGANLFGSSKDGGQGSGVTFLPGDDRLMIDYGGEPMLFDVSSPDAPNPDPAYPTDSEGNRLVPGIALSPDGSVVVGGGFSGEEAIVLWNLVGGDIVTTLVDSVSFDEWNLTVAFSPDGTQIAIASGSLGDNYDTDFGNLPIGIYDVATGEQLQLLHGHKNGVTQLNWSPDGNWLVSSSRDGTSRLWDAAAGKEFTTLLEVEGVLSAAAFSPDGETIAVGALNGVIYLIRQA